MQVVPEVERLRLARRDQLRRLRRPARRQAVLHRRRPQGTLQTNHRVRLHHEHHLRLHRHQIQLHDLRYVRYCYERSHYWTRHLCRAFSYHHIRHFHRSEENQNQQVLKRIGQKEPHSS